MSKKAPGKHYRKGMTVAAFFEMFPDDTAAEQWFVKQRWPNGVCCVECGSVNVQVAAKRKRASFRCREKGCDKQFCVRTNTCMHGSKLGYRKWLFAVYAAATNLKGVASMKTYRDLGVTQKTAWFINHRIRRAWKRDPDAQLFSGPVEADETYVGGLRRNMPKSARATLTGRGAVGKVAVVGVRDRATNRVSAQVVQDTEGDTLKGFVMGNVVPGTTIYTDDAKAYTNLPNHQAVKHSVAEYVRGQVHTNGIESFWATLKRAHKGTFHRLSPKHLHRYVDEFVGRHNARSLDTIDQMAKIAKGMDGKRLRYRDLVG